MLPSVTCTSYTLSGRAAGPVDHGAGGDIELRAVALAHDRRPGEQSSGQRHDVPAQVHRSSNA
jgi:hypothetical protein